MTQGETFGAFLAMPQRLNVKWELAGFVIGATTTTTAITITITITTTFLSYTKLFAKYLSNLFPGEGLQKLQDLQNFIASSEPTTFDAVFHYLQFQILSRTEGKYFCSAFASGQIYS
ncbi:hypothetical protein PoB_001787100 [Plakobranchus ocellatus]|uniref:Uncharacterized protein n=1 Tax=Plakobranchus ocellatus TaxID=259542 RepID=A0AAV3Z658_9GAST|nr:hypothetical protein PoB_001787100 [Plakobranchus ocellatus]